MQLEPHLFSPNGRRLSIGLGLDPPEISPYYFGWNTPDGPICIAMDAIVCMAPQLKAAAGTAPAEATGYFLIGVKGIQSPLACPSEDALRLLKRMGWKTAGGTPQDK